MKKILFFITLTSAILATGILLSPVTNAGTDCFKDPIYDRDWNAEVTTGVFVRDVACMEGSEVLTTLPVGEVIHVIAETDGWYKIERNDGTIGWVGQWLVAPTSKAFATIDEPEIEEVEELQEPMYDISGHKYESAIWFVYNNEIVNGYEDGSYQADKTINRAELLKIIIEAVYDDEFESYKNTDCFSDVPVNEWYTKYVCFAKAGGIVEGYSGNKFKPAQEITFVEALKIAMVGFRHEFEQSDPWYKNLVEQASNNNFIPLDVSEFNQDFTRGQMAELITRILKFESEELEDYLGDSFDESVTYEMLE
jgi:hypothetical protein